VFDVWSLCQTDLSRSPYITHDLLEEAKECQTELDGILKCFETGDTTVTRRGPEWMFRPC